MSEGTIDSDKEFLSPVPQRKGRREDYATGPHSSYAKASASALDGHYTLGEVLGEGTFSIVFRAKCCHTHDEVAIKMIKPPAHPLSAYNSVDESAAGTGGSPSKYIAKVEIAALRQLSDHPNIVNFREAFGVSGIWYIVLDYLPGADLLGILLQKGPGSRLDEPSALSVFCQLAGALQFSHTHGIAHRDIKLENVIVGKGWKSFLIDFGLCWKAPEDWSPGDAGLTNDATGTLEFCAPEILARNHLRQKYMFARKKLPKYDVFASDIFSLGVVLFVMLFGTMPYNVPARKQLADLTGKHRPISVPPQPSGNELDSKVSRLACDMLKRMLEVDPLKRCNINSVTNHPWVQHAMSNLADDRGVIKGSAHHHHHHHRRSAEIGDLGDPASSFLPHVGLAIATKSPQPSPSPVRK